MAKEKEKYKNKRPLLSELFAARVTANEKNKLKKYLEYLRDQEIINQIEVTL